MKGSTLALAVAALAIATPASAQVVFFDDFNDGDTVGWTLGTNHDNAWIGSSGGNQLLAAFSPGAQGNNFFSRAVTTFTLADISNILLELNGLAAPCSGCTMRYQAYVDGNLVIDGIENVLTYRSTSLNNLAAGSHTLEVGVFSDYAFSGTFYAVLDDVRVTASAVPEPSSWAMMIGGIGLMGGLMRRRSTKVSYA